MYYYTCIIIIIIIILFFIFIIFGFADQTPFRFQKFLLIHH